MQLGARASSGRFEFRTVRAFPKARSGFRALLQAAINDGRSVLLPSFIGLSSKEGSGVFDPIRELGLPYSFYRSTPELMIDVADLHRKLAKNSPQLVLVIHYYGWPDPAMESITRIVRESGAILVEDSAHAMLSDVVGGVVGRQGDASLWSLPKLLPVETGGTLLTSPRLERSLGATLAQPPARGDERIAGFDLAQMAIARRANFGRLLELTAEFPSHVRPLRPSLQEGVVPQSFPIVVVGADRDTLYQSMNAEGFGVVSLYHTLIPEILPGEFPLSHDLARSIMNLPLHESATDVSLAALVKTLVRHIEAQSEKHHENHV